MVVDTIAALKALSAPNVATTLDIWVNGYYAAGDGGGGTFRWNNADATADNGGTVIIPNAAPGTGRWNRVWDGAINVLWFGAKGDGATDDAAAIRAAINYANSRKVFVPGRQYIMGSGISATVPIFLEGEGTGAGPGSASQNNSNCTQFLCNFANPTLFLVTTRYPSVFRDFQINVNTGFRPAGSGYGIKLIGDGTATVSNFKIENVSFNYLYRGIELVRPQLGSIVGCYFGDWVDSAVYSTTDTTVEGSTGHIRDCFFFGQTSAASQTSCIYLGSGYTTIDGNTILGAQVGIRISAINFPAGFIKIVNNTIEEQKLYGIYADTNGNQPVTMLDISHNEFSQVANTTTYTTSVLIGDNGGTKWLKDLMLIGNTSRHSMPAGTRHYWIGAGENTLIQGNIGEELGANNPEFILIQGIGSNAALGPPCQIVDNVATSTTSANFAGSKKYSIANVSTGAVIKDNQGIAFASLPTNISNGTQIYCTDGLRASNPLTGASTGAIATRLNGAWSGG
jgi:hypothetical protein